MHGPSPSTPIFTNLNIQATYPPLVREWTKIPNWPAHPQSCGTSPEIQYILAAVIGAVSVEDYPLGRPEGVDVGVLGNDVGALKDGPVAVCKRVPNSRSR